MAQPRSQRDQQRLRHAATTPNNSFNSGQVAAGNAAPMSSGVLHVHEQRWHQRHVDDVLTHDERNGYHPFQWHDGQLQPDDGHGHGAIQHGRNRRHRRRRGEPDSDGGQHGGQEHVHGRRQGRRDVPLDGPEPPDRDRGGYGGHGRSRRRGGHGRQCCCWYGHGHKHAAELGRRRAWSGGDKPGAGHQPLTAWVPPICAVALFLVLTTVSSLGGLLHHRALFYCYTYAYSYYYNN